MEYKVLIKLFVPEVEQSFEMYIPVNKTVSQVIFLMNKVVNDMTLGCYPIKDTIKLINRRSNVQYDLSKLIRNTDIKNGTELVIY